jgi:hypothetical protein
MERCSRSRRSGAISAVLPSPAWPSPHPGRTRPTPTALHLRPTRAENSARPAAARVVQLPTDLIRHDVMLYGGPPGDAVVAEIVDDVLIPVLRQLSGSASREKTGLALKTIFSTTRCPQCTSAEWSSPGKATTA